MAYQQRPPDPGGAGVTLLILLLGGLIVIGGAAFLWYRSHLLEQAARQAQAAEAQAMARRARAAAMMEQRRQRLARGDLIDVAPADSIDAEAATPEVAITLDAMGALHLRGTPVRLEDLEGELHRLTDDRPAEWRITIWADEECNVRHVTDVLATCKQAGFENVQLATQPIAALE